MLEEARLRSLPPKAQKKAREKLFKRREKLVRLLPDHVAEQLRREIGTEEMQAIKRAYSKDLPRYLLKLRESEGIDDAAKRNFRELGKTVKAAERYAHDPPSNYSTYSKNILKLDQDLRRRIERLIQETSIL